MDIKFISDIKTADEARECAIDYQKWVADNNLSYGELADWQEAFREVADKWPELREEFVENAII